MKGGGVAVMKGWRSAERRSEKRKMKNETLRSGETDFSFSVFHFFVNCGARATERILQLSHA